MDCGLARKASLQHQAQHMVVEAEGRGWQDGPREQRQPVRVLQKNAPRMTAGGLELALPRRSAVRPEQPLDEPLEHEVVKLLLAPEVDVKRHRWRPNLG